MLDLREFFTHMETSPLPVKGFKSWPILGTHCNWAVRIFRVQLLLCLYVHLKYHNVSTLVILYLINHFLGVFFNYIWTVILDKHFWTFLKSWFRPRVLAYPPTWDTCYELSQCGADLRAKVSPWDCGVPLDFGVPHLFIQNLKR